jgi:hypothetical protein
MLRQESFGYEVMNTSMLRNINNFIKRPETIFLLTALTVLIVSFLFWGESLSIDLVALTVFIDGITAMYLLASTLVIYWVLYILSTRFLLSKYLTWLHITITVGIVVILLGSGKWFLKSDAANDLQGIIIRQLMINEERSIRITSTFGLLFIFGQLIYLINLTTGLVFRRR